MNQNLNIQRIWLCIQKESKHAINKIFYRSLSIRYNTGLWRLLQHPFLKQNSDVTHGLVLLFPLEYLVEQLWYLPFKLVIYLLGHTSHWSALWLGITMWLIITTVSLATRLILKQDDYMAAVLWTHEIQSCYCCYCQTFGHFLLRLKFNLFLSQDGKITTFLLTTFWLELWFLTNKLIS